VLAAQQRLARRKAPWRWRETLAWVTARVQAGAGATAEVARARVALALAGLTARNLTHRSTRALAAIWEVSRKR
jgi:outer membrane protein TolC